MPENERARRPISRPRSPLAVVSTSGSSGNGQLLAARTEVGAPTADVVLLDDLAAAWAGRARATMAVREVAIGDRFAAGHERGALAYGVVEHRANRAMQSSHFRVIERRRDPLRMKFCLP